MFGFKKQDYKIKQYSHKNLEDILDNTEKRQIYTATLLDTNKTQLQPQSREKQPGHLVQLTLGMS